MRRKRSGNGLTFLLSFAIIAIIVALGLFLWKQYQANKDAIGQRVATWAEEVTGEEKSVQENTTIETTNPLDQIQSANQGSYNSASISNYYYNQLDENAKVIYHSFIQHNNELKTGVADISLGDAFSNVLSQENGQEILGNAFQSAWDAFAMDRPDIFYLNTGKMYLHMEEKRTVFKSTYNVYIGKGNEVNYFANGFSSQEQVEGAMAEVESVASQIANQASGDDYQRIKYVHDWIVNNIEYDQTLNRPNTGNIYGALIEKNVVCEGYADSFKYMMDRLGIPCVIVNGTGMNSEGKTESHAWNYVQLGGGWYAVDCTWDDPVIRGGGKLPASEKYKYFLKGSEVFNKDHFPEGQLTQKGQSFQYPELQVKAYR